MEMALRTLLLGEAALTDLVGNAVDWGLRTGLPGVRMSEISGVPGMTYSGPTGWMRSRVQIDAWAKTYSEAWAIAEVIGGRRGLLVGMRRTVGGVRLRSFVVNKVADTDSDGANTLHRIRQDVMIWHAN